MFGNLTGQQYYNGDPTGERYNVMKLVNETWGSDLSTIYGGLTGQ